MVIQGALGALSAQCHAQIEKARLAQLFELPHRDLRYIDPLVRHSFAYLTSLSQAGSKEGDGLGCGVRNASFCLSAAVPQRGTVEKCFHPISAAKCLVGRKGHGG